MLLTFATPNSATQLSGWDNELSEPEDSSIVPAKCEAAARTEKGKGIITPICKRAKVLSCVGRRQRFMASECPLIRSAIG